MIEKCSRRFCLTGEMDSRFSEKEIYREIREQQADAVMLCGLPSDQRNDLLKYCIAHDITTYVRPSIGDVLIGGGELLCMDHLPVMLCQRASPSLWYRFVKRAMDILLSCSALVVFSPLMLLTAIAIKLQDGGPVIFTQRRLTLNRQEFMIHKFRSMKVDADRGGKRIVTLQNDDRITPVGKWIRRFRIDELPQFFDVLIGQMSLVGPRPERVETVELYENEMPEFGLRLQVKGGLTGYAQVYGTAGTSPYDKLQMDLLYIGQQSITVDFKIMFATVKTLFSSASAEGFQQDINAPEIHAHDISV